MEDRLVITAGSPAQTMMWIHRSNDVNLHDPIRLLSNSGKGVSSRFEYLLAYLVPDTFYVRLAPTCFDAATLLTGATGLFGEQVPFDFGHAV